MPSLRIKGDRLGCGHACPSQALQVSLSYEARAHDALMRKEQRQTQVPWGDSLVPPRQATQAGNMRSGGPGTLTFYLQGGPQDLPSPTCSMSRMMLMLSSWRKVREQGRLLSCPDSCRGERPSEAWAMVVLVA